LAKGKIEQPQVNLLMATLGRKPGLNVHSTSIRQQVARMKICAANFLFPAEQGDGHANGYDSSQPTPSILFD